MMMRKVKMTATPHGATKKRGTQNAELRELKNRIAELEGDKIAIENRLRVAEKQHTCLSDLPAGAIREIVKVSVVQANSAGILKHVQDLAVWLERVSRVEVDSGK